MERRFKSRGGRYEIVATIKEGLGEIRHYTNGSGCGAQVNIPLEEFEKKIETQLALYKSDGINLKETK